MILLYTCGLRGELALLPRLHNFLRRLKPADARAFVLDIGEACDSAAWHCDVSGGRSVPVVLDGMGYHAANVGGYFAPDAREKIGGLVNMALVDEKHPHQLGDLWLSTTTPPPNPLPEFREGENIRLWVALTPSQETKVQDDTLHLARVDSRTGEVGVVTLTDDLTLAAFRVETMPASILPDPTIAGIVDFVISEARYAQKRRGQDADS